MKLLDDPDIEYRLAQGALPFFLFWWAAQDSNLEPSRYERRALPLS